MSKSVLSHVAGVLDASNFAFGVNPSIPAATVSNSPGASGDQTLTLYMPAVTLADGRTLNPFATNAPLLVDIGANAETVTPSAVSVATGGPEGLTVYITADFSNVHGQGCRIASGTAGLQEALNYAGASLGGGVVVVDGAWAIFGGTSAIISAAIPQTNVSVFDRRGPTPRSWNSNPAAAGYVKSGWALAGAPQIAQTTSGAVSPHADLDGLITKAGVWAGTLAAPTSGTDDGNIIALMSGTANAHTLTATGLLQTGSADVNEATFAAYAGANLVLRAYQGKWQVLTSVGVTFS